MKSSTTPPGLRRSGTRGAWIPLVACLVSLVARAAEVPIHLTPLWPEPGDVVVHVGDTVTWTVDRGRAARVRGFEGEFSSSILSGDARSFSFVYRTPGLHAYENEWLNPLPPYDPAQDWTRSRGTVEVVSCDPGRGVFVNAPVPGARFAVRTDASGKISSPAAVFLQASVSDWRNIRRVDFQVDGATVASATEPPFRTVWIANRIGPAEVTAIALSAGDVPLASAPVRISVEAIATAKLFPPRRVRPNLYLVEYMISGGNRWVLQVGSDVLPSGEPLPDADYQVFLHGQWGRFPMDASAPRRFLWLEERP